MKTNICVFGLVDDFSLNLSKRLADELEMFFADIGALIEFELMDVGRAKDLCGSDYVKECERKAVKNIVSFENTLCVCSYSLLNDNENLNTIKGSCYTIYLKFNRATFGKILRQKELRKADLELRLDMMHIRDKLCKKYADIVVSCNSLNDKKIITTIKKKLLGVLKNGN